MGWTRGKKERREIIENIGDKETRRLPKARKTTAKMGGLSEERSKKGRGGRKDERKRQQQWAMENITKVAEQRSDNWSASPIQKGFKRKNKLFQNNKARVGPKTLTNLGALKTINVFNKTS